MKTTLLDGKARARGAGGVHAFATLQMALARRVWMHMNSVRTLGLAAETAFWLFLSLVPLAAVGALVAARFAVQNSTMVAPLFASMPQAVRDLVWSELRHVAAWNGGSVGPVAAVVFVWLASSGMHSVFQAFEVETGTERSWLRRRLLA